MNNEMPFRSSAPFALKTVASLAMARRAPEFDAKRIRKMEVDAANGKAKLVNGFALLASVTSREAALTFLEDMLARERAREAKE